MKKLIVLLLALSVVGLVAFAQAAAPAPALVWGGYLNTGAALQQTGTDSNTATITANAFDFNGGVGPDNSALDIFGKYDAGTYGMAFRYRAQDTFVASHSTLFMNRAYGWFNFANGMVKLQAGKLGHGEYETGGDKDFGASQMYRLSGFDLQVKPIAGLTVGGALPLPETAGLVTNVLNQTVLGFDYTMDKMGEATFGYKINGFADSHASLLWFYINVTAVDKLTAYVEGQMQNIGQTDAEGLAALGALTLPVAAGDFQGAVANTELYETIGYDLSPLTVGIHLDQVLYGNSTYGTWLKFDPYVSYVMGKTELGADVAYTMVDKPSSKSGYSVSPYAKFTLGTNTWTRVGIDYYGGDLRGFDPATESSYDFYADFVWQF